MTNLAGSFCYHPSILLCKFQTLQHNSKRSNTFFNRSQLLLSEILTTKLYMTGIYLFINIFIFIIRRSLFIIFFFSTVDVKSITLDLICFKCMVYIKC